MKAFQHSLTCRVVELCGLQGPGELVKSEDGAGRHCFRADELEGAWRGSLREEAFPLAQENGIDDQQDFIGKPMFEQRRYQRGRASRRPSSPSHRHFQNGRRDVFHVGFQSKVAGVQELDLCVG